jgi:hypothetical protein
MHSYRIKLVVIILRLHFSPFKPVRLEAEGRGSKLLVEILSLLVYHHINLGGF